MHYRDGTPAEIGDIVQHDSGAVGVVIGGQIGNDYCSTQVVKFEPRDTGWGGIGPGYIGKLRDEKQNLVRVTALAVSFDPAMQTRECVKIGRVNLG